MARGSDGESVLHKHLRVLQVFDVMRPCLTLTEIVDESGLAASTAHRLVAELEHEGLLERMPDRSYRLGVRLWEFAARTPGAVGLRELSRPFLEAVHARVRQHVQLGVLSGRDVLFLERLSTRDAVVNATVIGGRVPLPVSSSGLVLLAHAAAGVVEDVVASGWPTWTPATIRSGDELRARLRRVRADGFAVTDGHIHAESRGVAVPIMDARGGAVHAALGVVVPSGEGSPQPLIELLTVAAAGISRALDEAGVSHGGRGLRTWASTSRKSREYFSSLDARSAG